jgi:large subunit ribosomal protein L4
VRWQLAKRQRGTHDVKNRGEIHRTGKKMYRQKGTGSARHGSARVNLFRGGGRSFGPTPRSHAIDLPKKVRALALKHALSAKAKDGGIIVLEKATVKNGKTGALPSSDSRTRSSSTAPNSKPISPSPRAISRTSTCFRCRASTSTTFCGGRHWC